MPALVRFPWGSLATPEGAQRLRRLVWSGLLLGQLKPATAKLLLAEAEAAACRPREGGQLFATLLRRIVERPPPPRDDE